jgi:hypothetical protein
VTHGLFAIAKGHVVEGVNFNALSPLAFVMVFSLFCGGPFRARLWAVGAGAFAVYGLVRFIGV